MAIGGRVAKLCLALSAATLATAAVVRQVDAGDTGGESMSDSGTYAPTSSQTSTVASGGETTMVVPDTSVVVPGEVGGTAVVPDAPVTTTPITNTIPQDQNTFPPATIATPPDERTPPPSFTTARPPVENTPPPVTTARPPVESTPTVVVSVTTAAEPRTEPITAAVPTARTPVVNTPAVVVPVTTAAEPLTEADAMSTAAVPTARTPVENTPTVVVPVTEAAPAAPVATAAVPTARTPVVNTPTVVLPKMTAAVPTARTPIENPIRTPPPSPGGAVLAPAKKKTPDGPRDDVKPDHRLFPKGKSEPRGADQEEVDKSDAGRRSVTTGRVRGDRPASGAMESPKTAKLPVKNTPPPVLAGKPRKTAKRSPVGMPPPSPDAAASAPAKKSAAEEPRGDPNSDPISLSKKRREPRTSEQEEDATSGAGQGRSNVSQERKRNYSSGPRKAKLGAPEDNERKSFTVTTSPSGAGSDKKGSSRSRTRKVGAAENKPTASAGPSASAYIPGRGVSSKGSGGQANAAEDDEAEKNISASSSTEAGTERENRSGRPAVGVGATKDDGTEKVPATSSSSGSASEGGRRSRTRKSEISGEKDNKRSASFGSSPAAPIRGRSGNSEDNGDEVDVYEDDKTEESVSSSKSTKAGKERDGSSWSRTNEVNVADDDQSKAFVGSGAAAATPGGGVAAKSSGEKTGTAEEDEEERSDDSGTANRGPRRIGGIKSNGDEADEMVKVGESSTAGPSPGRIGDTKSNGDKADAVEGHEEENSGVASTGGSRPRKVSGSKRTEDEVNVAEDDESAADGERGRRSNYDGTDQKIDEAEVDKARDSSDTGSADSKLERKRPSKSSEEVSETEDKDEEGVLDDDSVDPSPENVVDFESRGDEVVSIEDDSVGNPADSLESGDKRQESGGSGCVSHQWLVKRGYKSADLVHSSPLVKTVFCPDDETLGLPCGTEHHAVSIAGNMMSYGELCSSTNCKRSVERVNSLWAFHHDSRTGIRVTSDSEVQLYMHDVRYPNVLQVYLHLTLSAARKVRYGMLTLGYPTVAGPTQLR